jgi:soluble lytic murein transglycosylase-like protein
MKGISQLRRIGWVVLTAAIALAAALPLASAADLARLRNGFTIRHERRQTLGENTRLFLSDDSSSFIDVPTSEIETFEVDPTPPAPAPVASATSTSVSTSPAAPAPALKQVVDSASEAYHLDPDLVNSVIHAESGFNSRAVSPKGARGLMQLMPSTAGKLGVANPFDPQANVGGGTRYLRELLERYNFDLVKALAAYNAGPKRVEQYGGVPPYRETRAYVNRIVRDYNRKKIAEEKRTAHATARSSAPKRAPVKPASKPAGTEPTVASSR